MKTFSITLNERNFSVSFPLRAMRALAEKHGTVSAAISICANMASSASLDLASIEAIVDIVHAGLAAKAPDITREFVYDACELSDIVRALPTILAALLYSINGGKESAVPTKA